MSLFRNDNKTNWDRIDAIEVQDSVKYRNVYEEQQLERSNIEGKQTPFTRTVGAIAITAGVVIAAWLLISLIEMAIGEFPSLDSSNFESIILFQWERSGLSYGDYLIHFSVIKIVLTLICGVVAWGVSYTLLMRNLQAQNLMNDPSDINQYTNDQHIALPEEIQRQFDWFPDAGCHSDIQVSSMISHMALSNKGLKRIEIVQRHAEGDDDSEFYAAIEGDTEELDIKRVPVIDEKFTEALFEASGAPKEVRKTYDATRIPYNPGNKNREKLKGYDTVADLINGDWEMPYYEVQRPGGAYLVDTDPVNTMVLAITRAGKGQTVIEPTIDMWLREKRPNNIVINDPKGELLVKNYVPAAVRGFQPVQFNLINAMKTDIYNPLILAAQAAREGDSTKCALYVENIADVFFPLEGSEDPVWPNAANNAFKRAAYGLIDYYLEEERALRQYAAAEHMPPSVLDTKVDQLWGHVTLYNCYQLFVQLTAKKNDSPEKRLVEIQKKYSEWGAKQKEAREAGEPDPPLPPGAENDPDFAIFADVQRWNEEKRQAEREKPLWDGQVQVDQLTLYFNATGKLPRNSMRTLVSNADNALRAMGGAEKMMASVYGIAITAMSFFSDPTISTLTSGTPSQNVDLGGLSFPRRLGVQFHPGFIQRYHLMGLQAVWTAYVDERFEHKYEGADFYHEDMISREGWARFYFKGLFPNKIAYLKLEVRNAQSGMLVKTFYFRFEKLHQKSLDGRHYVTDPVLDCKIVKNGILSELVYDKASDSWRTGKVLFPYETVDIKDDGSVTKVKSNVPAIQQEMVRYAEKPKVVFLVTPPHLMKYAKLILILVKQLVDLNFDASYLTKSNQKPLYKTRFMLDELGNLQSEGHGINGFQTMLSIGLGQDQQFTIILQTLQQLRDVYGDSVDKIVQGNAQPLSSQIATPYGYKHMGDIQIGDELLSPDGRNTQVIGVYPRGVRKVYEITLADGRKVRACGEHLWNVEVA